MNDPREREQKRHLREGSAVVPRCRPGHWRREKVCPETGQKRVRINLFASLMSKTCLAIAQQEPEIDPYLKSVEMS